MRAFEEWDHAPGALVVVIPEDRFPMHAIVQDMVGVVPLLSKASRAWLREAIALAHSGNAWLERLQEKR